MSGCLTTRNHCLYSLYGNMSWCIEIVRVAPFVPISYLHNLLHLLCSPLCTDMWSFHWCWYSLHCHCNCVYQSHTHQYLHKRGRLTEKGSTNESTYSQFTRLYCVLIKQAFYNLVLFLTSSSKYTKWKTSITIVCSYPHKSVHLVPVQTQVAHHNHIQRSQLYWCTHHHILHCLSCTH